jgi:hypothetical protein
VRRFAAFIGIVILAAIYMIAAAAVLVFVTTPLVLGGLAIGLLAGVLLGLQRCATVLTGRSARTELRTAHDAAAGRLPGRVRADSLRRDLAWPQYFATQVLLDLRALVALTASSVRRAWSSASAPLSNGETRAVSVAFFPLWLPILALLVTLTAGAAVAAGVVVVVTTGTAALAWSVGVPAVALLRAGERGWQVAVRATGSCPHCYYVDRLPAFRCPGPHDADDRASGADLHRDIRPGRLGVLWRRCACGRRLPTTVVRATRRLEARCPRCTKPLPARSGAARDIRVPVFGATSAGKTNLILAALVALSDPKRLRRGTRARLPSDADQAALRQFREALGAGRRAPKTSASRPVAMTLMLRRGLRPTLLHLFDAAGEVLVDPRQNSDLAYFDNARTLVFVIDPFSVDSVRQEAAAGFPELLAKAQPATYDAEQSYNATVTRLHRYGVATDRQHLAFVVSKGDLLRQLPVAAGLGEDSASVRKWIIKQRLDNLVTAATRDFANVRYFVVAAAGPNPNAAEPLRWLLETERVRV